jgi:arylformamidase
MNDHDILLASDAACLREQYFLRGAVPDHQEFFDRYAAASQRTYADFAHESLAYGESPRQRIDLFPARDARQAPLLAFLHGGYWQSFDRSAFAFVARPFLEAGAAVALLGYDLAPEVRMQGITAQIARAVALLAEEAPTKGIDGGRLFLAGHSAGAHLVAATLADLAGGAAPVVGSLIAGACVISGVFELEPIRRSYLNEVLRLDAAEAAMLSPRRRPHSSKVPVMITLGALETAAYHAQSRAYAGSLEAAGAPFVYRIEPVHHHFSIIQAFGEPANPATRWLLRQMGLA